MPKISAPARDLDRRCADAARRSVDQHPITLCDTAHDHQPAIGCDVVDRDRRSLLEAEPIGERQRLIRGDGDERGVPAEPGPGNDPVANGGRFDALPTDSTSPATS